jgi:hypothetical protein
LAGLARGRLRRRNPGPPPFSSMNSTPANSNPATRIVVLKDDSGLFED